MVGQKIDNEFPWVGIEIACELPCVGQGILSEIPTLGMSNQKIEPHISWNFLKYSAHRLQKFEFIRQTGKSLPNRLFDNRGIANAVPTKQNEHIYPKSYVKC